MRCIKSGRRIASRAASTAKQHTTISAATYRTASSFSRFASSSAACPSVRATGLSPSAIRLHSSPRALCLATTSTTTARVPPRNFYSPTTTTTTAAAITTTTTSSSSSKMAPPPKSAHEFLDFVNASPTPYHAVQTASALLTQAGFTRISERDPWSSSPNTAILPGGKYFLTRNASSLIAFAVGSQWTPGNPIAMIGAHTDSPCLRIKPVSKRTANGYLQVGVETYGGGIWHSWFDRDLSVAGRVLVKVKEGEFEQRLVRVEKPIVRIPSLAIHLHRQSNFDPNKEEEMVPIAGLVEEVLNKKSEEKGELEGEAFEPLKAMDERHHPEFLELIAKEAGVGSVGDIQDFELILYDTQKAVLGGLNDEFIYSGRLDNLDMTFCGVKALMESVKDDRALEGEKGIRLVACFDHEEIGSLSAHGADSNLLPAVLRRLSVLPGTKGEKVESNETAFEQTLAKSFLISADMAHAVHPNYAGKYERNHQPQMNKGTVIKINANQRYATNSPGIVLVQECGRRKKVPLQLFVVKNDSPCGSTIGPMLSAKLGVRTLDLGNPQLSMHSIREMGGSWDVEYAIGLFEGFLSGYGEMEGRILVD
ncbi:putative aspartyl aminopeptidase [Triangularia setosa]|uniref:aspartyl aminopeptidase n=1 Tax=Triangularia setosa TaxID=2587417 RepID=A0AAN6WDF7_9PEZI|nr:putative aspartyl aminopeptidase [Podospora setosa]